VCGAMLQYLERLEPGGSAHKTHLGCQLPSWSNLKREAVLR
jgi:hypothetical protein